MIKTIESEKLKIISRYEDELIRLSIEIAEKIIRHEIDTKDDIVSGIIKNAIKDYRNADWIKIYLSDKEDAETIQADKELISELKKISKDIKIEVMEELEKGGLIIETADGIVEASIDTQLKNLKEMVLNKNAG
jgi:flagellar assembly protein FliH